MIQRIQTVYLFLSAVVLGLVFAFPLADLLVDDKALFIFRYRGLYEIQEGKEILAVTSFPLAILFAISLLITIVTIFLYKKRNLQMRLSIINILIMLASPGVIYYYIAVAFASYTALVSYSIFATMPIIASILTYMAYRGIRKDELLVMSMDRIR